MVNRIDDYISRQAAIDALDRFSLGETDAIKLAFRMGDYLKRMPSADVQPAQHGHWIFDKQIKRIRCSECLAVTSKDDLGVEVKSDYCGVCGARMDGE